MALPCDLLLHPELMNNQQLIYIIEERQLRVPNIEKLSRDELLTIFHQFCVPYGQRKYRDSGRGKILNKSRNLTPENSPPKINIAYGRPEHERILHRTHNDILKPTPDLLSGHMKRIKLDSLSVLSNGDKFKRKLSIDNMVVTDSPPPKKERKQITWP
ncbi:unnamed protein product [Leptidea sinapis]|uniref:Uncharacterized protein n=1 Tax=Leptidea sinapis TaxID=189913 RepID=A0A5E4PP21_9NEOP|nr:unnamed protein product [Leptidea sinapis]